MAESLSREAARMQNISLVDLFQREQARGARYSGEVGPLFLDYSKQHIDTAVAKALLDFAETRELAPRLQDIAVGRVVNTSEGRAACHNRLRASTDLPAPVRDMRAAMAAMAAAFAGGEWPRTAARVTHIVNIGIGGSDLGPRLLVDALSGIENAAATVEFIANIDPANLQRVLQRCNPASTLFIVSSKSFSTEETRRNADAAWGWLAESIPAEQVPHHFVAVTANPDAARARGYRDEQIITFPEWVGGRFSIWSAIGLPVALAFGMDTFENFLAGGAAIDDHALSVELKSNHVIALGLLDVWNSSFLRRDSLAVLPYDHNLRLLPDYLQQLMMESNGKSVTQSAGAVAMPTSPIVWGNDGTNGQHSFHQLLHQGTQRVSCDFLLPLASTTPHRDQHAALVAHCLSQSLVLMRGQAENDVFRELLEDGMAESTARELARHKSMSGNRPSTTICYPRTSAESIGAVIALYEYRVLVAAILWEINPFDQWGVELGKKVSGTIADAMTSRDMTEFDASTRQLLNRYYSVMDDQS